MDINFNNLRIQTGKAFEELTLILNSCITNENHYYPNKEGNPISGDMIVDSQRIKRLMDELRSNIWIINCVFNKDEPDFQVTCDEINKSRPMTVFNDDEETDEY